MRAQRPVRNQQKRTTEALRNLIDRRAMTVPFEIEHTWRHERIVATIRSSDSIALGNRICASLDDVTDYAKEILQEDTVVGSWLFWEFQDLGGNTRPLPTSKRSCARHT